MASDPEYQRKYRQRPEVKARKKAWRQANPEKELERKRRWREANRERSREYQRKWYAEKGRDSARAYYLVNRDEILAQRRVYLEQNRRRIAQYQREWYEKNREAVIERTRAWAKAHPNEMRGYSSARRARERTLPAEQVDFLAVFGRDAGICGICGGEVDAENWHLDHIVPLCKGGHHTYANVQVSHPQCNLRKGTRLAA